MTYNDHDRIPSGLGLCPQCGNPRPLTPCAHCHVPTCGDCLMADGVCAECHARQDAEARA